MTVESSTSRVSYTGSGTTGPFAVAFYFLENDDLKVIKTTNATGAEEVLTLTTDYTVTGAADPDGGSVTLVSPISSAYSLVIVRDPDRLQATAYPRNDPFPAASHERALDKLTMLVQRMRDLFDRSFRLSDGDVSGVDLEISESATARANKYLGFDSSGNLTLSQSLDTGSVVISAYMETVLDDMDAPAALTTLGVSAFAQTLLDDASASAARTTLGLGNAATGTIGTDVQAYDADIPTVSASQAEMEAGTESALRSMSPLRIAQAIAALGGGGALLAVTTYTANGTHTTHASATKLLAFAVGGGGAGGGAGGTASTNSWGTGGKAGAQKWAYTASPAASYAITVGAGGTGVSGVGTGLGNAGGNTIVGALLTAEGGQGGSMYEEGTTFTRFYGDAGESGYGIGGARQGSNAAGNAAGANTGAGGGGARDTTNGARAGGAGGSGLVIIWEFA